MIQAFDDGEYLYISSDILKYRKTARGGIYVLLCMILHPEYNDLLIANELDMQLEEVVRDIQNLTDNKLIEYNHRFHMKIPRNISPDVRKKIFERDKRCVACLSCENLEIDHIIPVARGGNNKPDNLQILCKRCNQKKSAKL